MTYISVELRRLVTTSWNDHFRLDDATIEPLTAEGRVTVNILQMNRSQAVAERDIFIRLGTYPCGSQA